MAGKIPGSTGQFEGLPTVYQICVPREDVLSGKQTQDIFAANLGLVTQDKAPPIYQDPVLFFENTYPTEGLKTTIREVFGRLSGSGGSPVVKLETSLGGGKTHTLIALYHLAKDGSSIAGFDRVMGDFKIAPMRVAAVVGTEIPLHDEAPGKPRTLWGEIIYQLCGKEGYAKIRSSDEARTSPGERLLREILGDKKSLILIDETALYLARASAVKVGDSSLSEQTVAFLQELTQVASGLNSLSVVITTLNKDTVFGIRSRELQRVLDEDVKEAKAKAAVGDADEILSRIVRNLTPTKGEEFAAVVQHRLFKSINKTAAVEVCKAYHQAMRTEAAKDYLPSFAKESQYLETLKSCYPFHPELINILRTKTSSITAFNQTRGVLRLLSLLVKQVWDSKAEISIIHAYHIDFNNPRFIEELVSRLDRGEYRPAIEADLVNREKPPRAVLVDQQYDEPYGSWIWIVTFLNSLVGMAGAEVRRGASEQEIYLAIFRPKLDLKKVETAMKKLEDIGGAFFLNRVGAFLAISPEPTLNRVIETAKDAVGEPRILRELEDRILALYGGRHFFDPRPFANEPSKVPDDTGKPKLVVMHFNDCDTTKSKEKAPDDVLHIYEKEGTQGKPRVFINNLVFLVIDHDEKENIMYKGREFLALKDLIGVGQSDKSGIAELSSSQREKVDERRKESELFLKVAILVAYKHVFIPSKPTIEEGGVGRRALRRLIMRVTDADVERRLKTGGSQEESLVEFLKENHAARDATDKPLDPEYILEYLWPKKTDEVSADDFRKLFYRNPAADLIFSEELISKSLREGIRQGKWYAVASGEFYDKSNHTVFAGGFLPDTQIVLAESKTGEELQTQFYCETCGKRKSQCLCKGKIGGEKPGIYIPVPPSGNIVLRDMKLERAAIELKAQFDDQEVSQVKEVTFKAGDRTAMIRLALAAPQFQKAKLWFNLDATIDQKHEGKNFLSIHYVGDLAGYNAAKGVLVEYEKRSQFDMHELMMYASFEPSLSAEAFLELLAQKVASFTQDSLYIVSVTSVRKETKE